MAYSEALKITKDFSRATLYVNLEPCCHTGKKTPPCTELIAKFPVKKVVVCNRDPNPMVSGKGIEFLKSINIHVEEGVLNEEGKRLNEVFFLNQEKKRPFIHLKCATGLDGKIALHSGESKWITGSESRSLVHDYRFFYDAVLVGGNTLRSDNPKLNIREGRFASINKKNKKIIVTNPYKLNFSEYDLFNDANNVIILSTVSKESIEVDFPCNVIFPQDSFNWCEALTELYKVGVCSILVEGGAKVISTLIEDRFVDRFSFFQAPYLMGDGIGFSDFLQIKNLNEKLPINVDHYPKSR